MSAFEIVHQERIANKLTCFDRLVFKGYLTRFDQPGGMSGGVRMAAYRFCELALERDDDPSAVWGALQALMAEPDDSKLWELYLRASARLGRRALEQA